MASDGLLPSFLGALQASLSVLLVIFYGVVAAQFKLLDGPTGKTISKVCVKMFLPALLITNLGSELIPERGLNYVVVLVYAVFCYGLSLGLGVTLTKALGLPNWFTPAIAFNNTTSYPLLLIQSLDATGIFSRLIVTDEKSSEAIERAKSYFLIFATIGDCLTFAVGPRLIDNEHAPDPVDDSVKQDAEHRREHEENRLLEAGEPLPTEQTSLISDNVRAAEDRTEHNFNVFVMDKWNRMPRRLQVSLSFLGEFFNAPLIGATIGALIGLINPLHRVFFNETFDGGWLNSWLTASLKNIGQLFVTLQVVVAGVTLSSSLRKMKRGEEGGSVPWLPATLVIVFRFVVWPAISISLVWALASKTSILGDDPILWFTLCLMPCGPTAMKLIPMVDVSEGADEERMSIAKLLTISYMVSPILALTVVGSLTASEAAIQS